ncbi:cyd operon YbgE family protein [Pseudoduganella danionis]|uniref:cyd operon YbgE family protein n=1 Tax=Pseudoduganella danionis TaxID=1890295 RepID=UPI0035B1921B
MGQLEELQFSRLHLSSLAAGLLLMLAATLYPPLFQRADGSADHVLATLLFAAMSTGLIRGVGYIPVQPVLRWIFSGWSCLLCLLLAAALKMGNGI